MTTTLSLRKILDRKVWEMMTPSPTTSILGSFIASSSLSTQLQMFVQASTIQILYRPDEDAWINLPSGALGALAAGTCGAHHPNGPTGTATAGSATTLTTNLTIPGTLVGYTIRLTGGTGAGQERVISANTQGANSVLTVPTWTVNPDATTTYLILSGRFYCAATTAAAWTFKYYDVATNTWSAALNVAALPAAWTIDGRLVTTTGVLATGTSTGSNTTTTLNNTGKAWATNQFANHQVRITGGTGAGQLRTISSNTGTALTVSAVWTVTPDATSTYAIEGNEDYLYLMGNNAVTMYRYSISGNVWTTLSPGVARSGAPGAGMSGHWVSGVTDSTWTPENALINGRRIYSFRGAAGNVLDYYDIPSNAWTNALTYQRQAETFTTGTGYALIGDNLYIHKDATGRFFRFNIPTLTLDPWSTDPYPQGAAVLGDRVFDTYYTDGGTTIRWINMLKNTGTELRRCMVI